GTSRIDLTPAQTTVMRVLASVSRSADSSWSTVQPRCTPPRPPVANTRTPARAARNDVAATVVAPLAFSADASGRSRWLSFRRPGSVAIRSSSASLRPTLVTPSSTAIVAGTAPALRTISSSSRATWRLRGWGSPCEMIVDSSATTGAPESRASATSSDGRIRESAVGRMCLSCSFERLVAHSRNGAVRGFCSEQSSVRPDRPDVHSDRTAPPPARVPPSPQDSPATPPPSDDRGVVEDTAPRWCEVCHPSAQPKRHLENRARVVGHRRCRQRELTRRAVLAWSGVVAAIGEDSPDAPRSAGGACGADRWRDPLRLAWRSRPVTGQMRARQTCRCAFATELSKSGWPPMSYGAACAARRWREARTKVMVGEAAMAGLPPLSSTEALPQRGGDGGIGRGGLKVPGMGTYDVVVAGGGHNGLVAAAYLARAGRRVLVLERQDHTGGLAISAQPFPGVDVRLSRYSYLVSLLPTKIVKDLGLKLELRRRRYASYTPVGTTGLLVDGEDADRTRASFRAVTGGEADHAAWEAFYGMTARAAQALAPTLLAPLRPAAEVEKLVGAEAWRDLFARPIGEVVAERFADDVVRGVVLTDALIGTFADPATDLLANRCFLYHVIGDGTGEWNVPVGGM